MDGNDTIQKLIAACRSAGRTFTMHDVLEHLIESEQALLLKFSDAWVELMQGGVIKLVQQGEPERYELAGDDAESRV